MDVNTRNRAELKSYFVKNSIPTESNFAEFIDGMLNQKDDGIVKPSGNPLAIEASGDSDSERKILNMYADLGDAKPTWTLSLNPRVKPGDAGSARPGLNISDGEGSTRLFIDGATGNIGIGTIKPTAAKLEVNGAFKATANVSGQGEIFMEAPADGKHRVDPDEGEEGKYKTGLVYRVKNNPDSKAPIFQVRSSGQAVRFFVDHEGWTGSRSNSAWFAGSNINYFAGNVGIGTSEPKAKLEVSGVVIANSGLRVDGNSRKHIDADGALYRYKGKVFLTVDDSFSIRDSSDGGKFLFGTNSGGVEASGDMVVSGAVTASKGLRVDGDSGAHIDADGAFYRYDKQVYLTVDDNFYIRDSGGDAKFHFDTNSGGLEVSGDMVVKGAVTASTGLSVAGDTNYFAGKVGIGATEPGEKLDVDGVVRARSGLRVDGDRSTHIDFDGALYRYGGQVYLTVDDNFYIRDSGGKAKFHFDTNSGIISQQGWQKITFQNSWKNYGTNYNSAGYFKDKQGIVHLKGLVKDGGVGKAIFTLPAGYRPAQQELQVVCTGGKAGRVDVKTNGQVLATGGDKKWFSLDGVTFRAK